jgi:hypothetical protein
MQFRSGVFDHFKRAHNYDRNIFKVDIKWLVESIRTYSLRPVS